MASILVHCVRLSAVAGVEEVDILVIVAAKKLLPVVRIHQARDVRTPPVIVRSHLEGGVVSAPGALKYPRLTK